jgi:hypothetical protein
MNEILVAALIVGGVAAGYLVAWPRRPYVRLLESQLMDLQMLVSHQARMIRGLNHAAKQRRNIRKRSPSLPEAAAKRSAGALSVCKQQPRDCWQRQRNSTR